MIIKSDDNASEGLSQLVAQEKQFTFIIVTVILGSRWEQKLRIREPSRSFELI